MSPDKQTVERYLSGFRTHDRDQILGCLTDDIRWTVFGAFHVQGKAAYAEHITEPGLSKPPRARCRADGRCATGSSASAGRS